MSSRESVVLGFVSAGLISGVGAITLNTLSRGLAQPRSPAFELEAPAPIAVRAVAGSVFIVSPAGISRPAGVGDSMLRPAGARLESPDAWVRLERGSTDVLLSHEARVSMSPKGGSITLYPSSGRMIVSSAAQPVEAVVSNLGLTVRGRSFGLWVRADETWIAVLGEDVRVVQRGREETYGPGREIVVSRSKVEPGARPPQLEVEATGITTRGGRTVFSGKTSPHAEVHVRAASGEVTKFAVAADGTFSVGISGDRPKPGEVVVHDAAGRHAELGLPASTAGSVDDAIRGLTARAAKPEPTKLEPKAPDPKPTEVQPADAKVEPAARPPREKTKPAAKARPKAPKAPSGPAKPDPTPADPNDPDRIELEWE